MSERNIVDEKNYCSIREFGKDGLCHSAYRNGGGFNKGLPCCKELCGYYVEYIPMIRREVLAAINRERNNQDKKWGEQSDNSLFEWMSILMEEVGELAEAVNETCFENAKKSERGGNEAIYKEAIQVAAVASAIAETIIKKTEGKTQ